MSANFNFETISRDRNLTQGQSLSEGSIELIKRLYDSGEYTAAYHYMTAILDADSKEYEWFSIAQNINGNFIGQQAVFANVYNEITDAIFINGNWDTQKASDAIADAVLKSILDTGRVPNVEDIIAKDAVATESHLDGFEYRFIGYSLATKYVFPEAYKKLKASYIARHGGEIAFKEATGNFISTALATLVSVQIASPLVFAEHAEKNREQLENIVNLLEAAISEVTTEGFTFDLSVSEFYENSSLEQFNLAVEMLLDQTASALAISKEQLEAIVADQSSRAYAEENGISFRADGAADYWVDQNGVTGQTSLGSYYDQSLLDNYGVTTEGGGARLTLGGHLRALADAVGLDGEPGIQGTYAKSGEGKTDAGKPIIIDLDEDGVEVGLQSVGFDWDDDGFEESGHWAAEDDGFLVIDLNEDGTRGDGDGKIDQGRELAFALWGSEGDTDLQALARVFNDNNTDASKDVLDSADSVWNELKIWQDLNQNGETDDGELKSLAHWGITQINLTYDDGSDYADTDDDISVFGNTLHGLASYVKDGETIVGGVGDVSLAYHSLGWREVDTELGYAIEFETGERYDYAVIESNDARDLNLVELQLDGATGDTRNNILDGRNGTSNLAISGGGGNDNLYGGNGDDLISGDEGADKLRGQSGNDTIFFDAADVASGIVNGGLGHDVAIVATEAAVVFDIAGNNFEVAYGNEGNDILDGVYSNVDLAIYGGGGKDTITGGASDDILSGDDGNDRLVGDTGSDQMFGGAGNDALFGEGGDDFFIGGTGNDYLYGSHGDDHAYGGEGVDRIHGGHGDDRLVGSSGNDSLYGGLGDDAMYGGDGNDVFLTGYGDDKSYGGAGNDVFQSSHAASYEIFQGGTGNDIIHLVGVASDWQIINAQSTETYVNGQRENQHGDWYDTYGVRDIGLGQYTLINGDHFIEVQDIEQIKFTGDGSVQTLSGVSSEADNSETFYRTQSVSHSHYVNSVWNGGSVDDIRTSVSVQRDTNENGDEVFRESYLATGAEDFFGGAGDDSIDAGQGHDEIIGGYGSDQLAGEIGNDTLFGEYGDDILDGGYHDDTLFGGSGADLLFGGTGNDGINGGYGDDQAVGGDGNDVIYGQDGSDLIAGSEGTDRLYGGIGSDTLWGDEGTDTLDGGLSHDTLYGGAGKDTLLGDWGNDVIAGGDANDTLEGGSGFDVLYGDAGNDKLTGGNEDDGLYGGTGDDRLFGGEGADLLSGGIGADTIDGGAGLLDLVSYADSASGVIVNLHSGDIRNGDAAGDTITNIEGVIGSEFGDFLLGTTDNSALVGLDGNDTIYGGAGGNDTLNGGDGDDSLYGGVDTDDLYGGAGNDILHAGSATVGRQYLEGGTGDDNYQISRWGGDHIIQEAADSSDPDAEGSGFDVIEFVNLSVKDVSFSVDENDMMITWSSGSVRVNDLGGNIERFEFADGSAISSVAADYNGDRDRLNGFVDEDDYIVGSNVTNQIYGKSGNDTLDAGGWSEGYQYLNGGDGNDIYLYGKDSRFVWSVRSGETEGYDTFVFTDLTLADLEFTITENYSTANGDVLNVSWDDGTTNGKVRFADLGAHIERFEFADGTIINEDDILNLI